MVYVFDIDGTICSITCGDYTQAVPFVERIEKNNLLYDSGHQIVYYTARGMGRSSNDSDFAVDQFYDLTKNQLKSWNVKYHQLFLGKPSGDIYVDDKGQNIREFYGD